MTEYRKRLEDATDCSGAAREDDEIVPVRVGDLRLLLSDYERMRDRDEEVREELADAWPEDREAVLAGDPVSFIAKLIAERDEEILEVARLRGLVEEASRYAALGRACESHGLGWYGETGTMLFQAPADVIEECAIERLTPEQHLAFMHRKMGERMAASGDLGGDGSVSRAGKAGVKLEGDACERRRGFCQRCGYRACMAKRPDNLGRQDGQLRDEQNHD